MARRSEPSIEGMGLFVPLKGEPLQERHLVDALAYAAYVVVRFGDKYAPAFEVVERELNEFRMRQSPLERARRALAASVHVPEGLPPLLKTAAG